MMNLAQSEQLLYELTQDYMKMIYRQSKITGSVQINFIAAKLGISSGSAETTAQFLQQTGMVRFEKYGRITLTDDGRQYIYNLLKQEKCVGVLPKQL